MQVDLDAYTDPASGRSSVHLEVSREDDFSTLVASVEGAAEVTIQGTEVSSYGEYFLRVMPGGLYCPTGYAVQVVVTTQSSLEPLNLTFIFQSNVRSRMMPVNEYESMCDMEEYVGSSESCIGGADRRAGYTSKVKASGEHVVCLDGGNAVVGTSFYSLYYGSADAELMLNYVPFDIYVPQEYEFNSGEGQLSLMLSYLTTQTATILSNVDWTQTVLDQSELQRYQVKEYGGRQVGFLGFVSEDIHTYAPELSEEFIVNPDTQDVQKDARLAAQLALVIDEIQESYRSCTIFVASGASYDACIQLLTYSEKIAVCFANDHEILEWDEVSLHCALSRVCHLTL
ncbi:hypothetical protein CYMTET_24442 [Cymbomonas tetramitiformis]|uniref:Uncharacterized protein n=1 Tax=Cymbomonas tetramitiformis TaxID=36881 RepID=A0AAE0FWP7_9CHLO|nr:hypothetical protein CYMTET_24442 [Cymbomonas tetramitiformis]